MQGLWKEKLSKWDHKDTKRKKQTRKHTLRDKGRYIYNNYHINSKRRKCNPDIFRIENEQVLSYYRNKKSIISDQFVQVFKIEILIPVLKNPNVLERYKNGSLKFESKKIYGYIEPKKTIFKNIYKEEKTKKNIKDYFELTSKQYNNTKCIIINDTDRLIETDWKERIKEREIEHIDNFYLNNQKEFIYNKKLHNWKMLTFYSYGNRKKVQKILQGSKRMKIRKYINKGNWDEVLDFGRDYGSVSWIVN